MQKDKITMEIKTYDFLHKDAILLRTEVFVDEQKFTDEFDDLDQFHKHFIAYENEVPIAVCRIYPYDEKTYAIGRIAVRKSYRGHGLGSMIVREAEKYIKNLGYAQVALSAQVRVKDFYEKLGYVSEGETFFEEYCEHIRMRKRLSHNFSFCLLDKDKADSVLSDMFDVLYANMSEIAPTGNSYEEDRTNWFTCVLRSLSDEKRQVVLLYDETVFVGYFQYTVLDTLLKMEDIQFQKRYHGSGLFEQLYRWIVQTLPNNVLTVEAIVNKSNSKSQHILEHLGLKQIGETPNKNSYQYRGEYQTIAVRYKDNV